MLYDKTFPKLKVFSTKIINLLCSYRLCSNEDLIFLGQATMGIMNHLQNDKKRM